MTKGLKATQDPTAAQAWMAPRGATDFLVLLDQVAYEAPRGREVFRGCKVPIGCFCHHYRTLFVLLFEGFAHALPSRCSWNTRLSWLAG